MPAVYSSVDVVKTPSLTIQEYIGNIASKDAKLSACLVTVTAPGHEPFQVAEFDEYLLVIFGLLVVTHNNGETTVAKQGEGLFLKGGMRLQISWPGPCMYVPICMPAFSPSICHREEEGGIMKDAAALQRLADMHAKAGSENKAVDEQAAKRPRTDSRPVVYKSVDVVSTPDLTITEYFGNVSSSDPALSACLATVTAPCQEAFQTPEFDEYVVVISGVVILQHGDGTTTQAKCGQGVLLKAGERVKWTWPGPCQYVPICLPAFTPTNCGREPEEGAVKTEATMQRLHELHGNACQAGKSQ